MKSIERPAVLLSTDSITKSFAGIHALKGVSFDVRGGEVHALIGENGAGKSTLIKIMTGAEAPDSGMLSVAGRSLSRIDPAAAYDFGIAAVYQTPSLFPHLTVAENLALGLEDAPGWRRVDWNGRRVRAHELLVRIGASIEPGRLVESLTMPEQQLVEIARALGADRKVLILDEPTASLSAREVDALLAVVRRLRDQGVGIVYISHRLEEVLAIADRITVLRDGRTVGTEVAAGLRTPDLVRRMVGDELAEPPTRIRRARGEVALAVRHLTSRLTGIRDVSISVRRGEVLGLAGLVGSGRTQLAEAIFGITPPDEGEILVAGAPVRVRQPSDAIRAGIGYVPEDRRQHGVVLKMSIAANSTLASLQDVTRRGLIDRGVEYETAARFIEQLHIKATPVAEVASLSGGNQQKVAVARWLATSPTVLILDEPTQGVDVRSKGEVHRIIQELANGGVAVILISSDFQELLALSDRIAVMRQGGIVGMLSRETASRHAVLALALGTNDDVEHPDVST
ncbi:MAG: sugar ABC transporter ATP-binding protein [Vicinamibacterales bacterium]